MKNTLLLIAFLFTVAIYGQSPFPTGARFMNATKSDTLSGQTRIPILKAENGNLLNYYTEIDSLNNLIGGVTLAGAYDYITISGQTITRNQIDLTTDVTGDLPLSNIAQQSAYSVLGRAGSGTGDVASITAGTNTILSRNGSGNVAFNSTATVMSMLGAVPTSRTLTINGVAQDLSTNRGWTINDIAGNAATATTLQTPRTINGTSFNGSANITTANWGTSRNLSIGGTSKAVNGSGNVTWSTTEIGITKTNIDALGINAATLGGLSNSQFLRRDSDNTSSGSGISNASIQYATFKGWQLGTGTPTISTFSNGTTTFFDLFTGNLVIRDNTTNRFTFERATGNFTATGDMTATDFILSSDRRLKKKIKEYEVAPIEWDLKTYVLKQDQSKKKRLGVIAQELEKKHPEFVETNASGYKAVSYIQLLLAKVAELEKRIEQLENR